MTSEAVSKCMRGNKRKDTKPELLVRRMLREMGYPGYRLQWKKAPGRPDIAFPGRRIAIFVNGCFWHQHGCKASSHPKENEEFWQAKFARNRERDEANLAALEQMGWHAIVIWECELKKSAREATAERLRAEMIHCTELEWGEKTTLRPVTADQAEHAPR